DWRDVFGSFGQPYPDFYKPDPRSRGYVLHLNAWYAQAHPAEDFAETFAVWLASGEAWRNTYREWPALRKLEYVDRTINQTPPPNPVPKRGRAALAAQADAQGTLPAQARPLRDGMASDLR